jgi:hypothetical protein
MNLLERKVLAEINSVLIKNKNKFADVRLFYENDIIIIELEGHELAIRVLDLGEKP